MPPTARVSVADAVKILKKYITQFEKSDTIPVFSSYIWQEISKELNGLWTPECVYVNVKNDRRQILSIACEEVGIPVPGKEVSFSVSKSNLEESATLSSEDSSQILEECVDLAEFKIMISAAEWVNIQGVDTTFRNGRANKSLCKGVWTNVLYNAIQRQTDLPCCFVFDWHRLARTARAAYYLSIRGHCRSQQCLNPIYCYIDEEPQENEEDILKVRTRNTLGDKHEDVRRYLSGDDRKEMGKEGFYKGCGNVLKEKIMDSTKFGGRVPPQVPSIRSLRQAKKEFSNDLYEIRNKKNKHVVENLNMMKYASKYNGSIHHIVEDKFCVIFSTPQQLHAYNQYCKITRSYSSISVDGTGSLVQKVERYNKTLSGHIFLYSIVINFDGVSSSVHDMLTESQDTNTILWWIKKWQDMGALKPKQVVCDSSRALMNGLCLALNFQTVKVYNETCFLAACGNEEFRYRPEIFTYLRLDVAHLQIQVRRWACFQQMRLAKVRHFFMYCFSLMIDCETLEEFKDTFMLICIVGGHEYQDTLTKYGYSVLEARKELENKIAQRNYIVKENEDIQPWVEDKTFYDESKEEKQCTEQSRVKTWINTMHKDSQHISVEGSEPNPFYFNDFIIRLIPLAVEFCLWTSVPLPYTRGRATSSYSEGHFSDVKNNVLKNFSGLVRADKFVKIILDNESSSSTLLHSKLNVFRENEGPCPSPPVKKIRNSQKQTPSQHEVLEEKLYAESQTSEVPSACDLNTIPKDISLDQHNPWHKKFIANRTGIYSQAQGDISYLNDLESLSKKQWLLRNGNKVKKPTLIGNKHYFVSNTCGFDSIVHILDKTAMDDKYYFEYMENSKSRALNFIKEFILHGPSTNIEDARVKLLLEWFKPTELHYESNALQSYSIDLYDTLTSIWKKGFSYNPSAMRQYECTHCGKYSVFVPCLQVNHSKFEHPNGFEALRDLQYFNEGSRFTCINTYCNKECIVTTEYSKQIFVELDVRPNIKYTSGKVGKLQEFPTTLILNKICYRLAGVIASRPGHFVAYCLRKMVHWQLHDDLEPKIINCTSSSKIVPEAAIYVQCLKKHDTNENLNLSNTDHLDKHEFSEHDVPMAAVSSELSVSAQKSNYNLSGLTCASPIEDPDTTSRDIWRKKEKRPSLSTDVKNFYATDNIKVVTLLQNGELRSGINIEKELLHFAQTSAFDAIVHILWCTAVSDDSYVFLSDIYSTENILLNFVVRLINKEDSESIYRQRAVIMQTLNEAGLCESYTDDNFQNPSIHMKICGTPLDVWKTCMYTVPSEHRRYECDACGNYTVPIPALFPYEIPPRSYYGLHKALSFYKMVIKVPCITKACRGLCTMTTTPNFQLFLNLPQGSPESFIDEIPKTIEREFHYRLAGIIAHYKGRYVAYCLSTKNWLLYDGYCSTVQEVYASTIIKPKCLIYIRECEK